MKNQVRLVLLLWACLLVSQSFLATTTPLRDSILIEAQANCKIIFIGEDVSTLLKYKRADSIVSLFVGDLMAAKDKGAALDARTSHYLVHPSGKRRIKLQNEDFQEPAFNLKNETASLSMNVPPYAYYIYDLQASVEIHVFLGSPDQLPTLTSLQLTDLLHTYDANKRTIKRYTSLELKKHDQNWVSSWRQLTPNDQLEITSLFGGALIGSKLSPEVGIRMSLVRKDKYQSADWSIGLTYNVNMLTSFVNNDFSDIQVVQSINAYFMLHGNMFGADNRSIGLQVGYLFAGGGLLNKSVRVGLLTNHSHFQFGFHTYFITQPNSIGKVMYGVSFNF